MDGRQLCVWLLACYGMTFLLCSAKIAAPVRRRLAASSAFFAGLIECYFCTGFWVALGTAVWVDQQPVWLVLHGFAGATSCYVLDAAIRRLEATETGDGFDQHTTAD